MNTPAELKFPVAGVDQTRAFADQRPRQVGEGVWGRTCYDARNVRAYEATADRRRGGTRPGLSKYLPARPVANWLIQDLNALVGAGTAVQTSLSGRVVYLTAVVEGKVYWSLVGSDTWTLSTNNASGSPPLNVQGIMFAAANNQNLFFADGNNATYWKSSDQSTNNWTATAGIFPKDSSNNYARLMETWRGRTCHAGFAKAEQRLVLSAQDDPFDYDEAPVPFVETAAVEFTSGKAGFVGDKINGLIPWSDDLLICLCDGSVRMLQGEPTDGGKMMDVSTALGGMWGRAWCRDPFGAAYWVGTDGSVYAWTPGSRPQEISTPIKKRLQLVNSGEYLVRLGYDHTDRCIHMFVTKTAEPADADNWTFELRTGGWQPLKFANQNHNPLALCTVDGNEPNDRALVFGSWDGYVRRFDPDAEDDDGTDIESFVWCGPINSPDHQEMLIDELLADLGEASGIVTYQVYVGRTAEAALASGVVKSGTLKGSRNHAQPISRTGHAVYVRFSSTQRWALERVRLTIEGTGQVLARRRGA